MGKQVVVGISGKIGSGKNYLADKLVNVLAERGYTTSEGSFAHALKNELSQIMDFYRHRLDDNDAAELASKKFNIPLPQMEHLLNCIKDDLLDESPDEPLHGYSRTEGIRRALQFLGTEIRRSVNPNYWVDLFHESLQPTDFIFVTDARFPNEADSVLEHGGVMLRLNPSPEVIAQRIANRDGLKYTKEALNHSSETALDDYTRFTVVIGDTFDEKKLADILIDQYNRK